jgi:hypothetical protein
VSTKGYSYDESELLGSSWVGGSYRDANLDRGSVLGTGHGLQCHHLPSRKSYESLSASEVNVKYSTAVQMQAEDHRKTFNYDTNIPDLCAHEQSLMSRGEVSEAFALNVQDIRNRYGDKYDRGIVHAEAHLLRQNLRGEVSLDETFVKDALTRQALAREVYRDKGVEIAARDQSLSALKHTDEKSFREQLDKNQQADCVAFYSVSREYDRTISLTPAAPTKSAFTAVEHDRSLAEIASKQSVGKGAAVEPELLAPAHKPEIKRVEGVLTPSASGEIPAYVAPPRGKGEDYESYYPRAIQARYEYDKLYNPEEAARKELVFAQIKARAAEVEQQKVTKHGESVVRDTMPPQKVSTVEAVSQDVQNTSQTASNQAQEVAKTVQPQMGMSM